MKGFLDRLAHEPTLANVVTLWVAVLNPSPAVMAAVAATVAIFVRSFSASKAAVAEAHEAGYNNALADVSALQPAVKPPPIPED